MLRKVVERSSFGLLLWLYYPSGSSCWRYILLLRQILVWLVAILPVIWLDVTSSSLACTLPATVLFVICHLSAFTSAVSLAWKRALYANPQSFHAVLFSCKTWQNMWTCLSCCTSAVYIRYYFLLILFLLVVCFLHLFPSVCFILQLLNLLCRN